MKVYPLFSQIRIHVRLVHIPVLHKDVLIICLYGVNHFFPSTIPWQLVKSPEMTTISADSRADIIFARLFVSS